MNVKFCARGILGLLMVACTLPASACGREHRCYPSRLEVSPSTVQVGGTVVLSSPPFDCDGSYPAGKTYAVTLSLDGRGYGKPLGSFPVNEDGSFRAALTIPRDASPGTAGLLVLGSTYDGGCDDVNASCASYVSPPLTLLR